MQNVRRYCSPATPPWRSSALRWGNTPLHVVSQAKQNDPDFNATVATIEVLLKYGVDPKALNNEGKTPGQWYRQLGMADYMSERMGGD